MFVSSSFLVLLRYCFLIFFSNFHLFDAISFLYSQVFVGFLYSELSDFLWFGSSNFSVMCRFPLFITNMAHLSLPNPIPISLLYILTVCIRVSNSFSFLPNSFMSSIYIKLIFSCGLLSFIRLCISWECDWVVSSLLQLVMVIMRRPGICLSGSLLLLSFFLLQSIPLSKFSWSSW